MPSKGQPQKLNLEDHEIPASDAHKQVALYAATLDDFMRSRISFQHRQRKLRESGQMPAVVGETMTDDITALRAAEKLFARRLVKAMKQHELCDYIERVPGLGLRGIGRLLGTIGQPAHRRPYARMLLNYSGFMCDDEGRAVRRKRGQLAKWNTDAHTLAFVVADSATKKRCAACTAAGQSRENGGWMPPSLDCTCWEDGMVYRVVFDHERERHDEATLDHEVPNYYGKGKHGKPGDPITDKHKQTRATRAVATAILTDLWIASRWAAGFPAFASPTMLQIFGDDIPWELHEAALAGHKIMPEQPLAMAAD